MSLPGMLQFITAPDTLILTSQAEILTAINAYAGGEILSSSEHVQEAFQMLTVKAISELGYTEETVSYYYYFDNAFNTFQIVAGAADLVATNQIQPKRAMLQLVIDGQGNIIGIGECYVTELAFPPASPFSPTFV